MGIGNMSDFFQKISKVRMLGETGELALAMLANINEFFHAGFIKKTKKLLGRLSRETDGADKNFHTIKSTRWLRRKRGMQTPWPGGGAHLGWPRRARKQRVNRCRRRRDRAI